VTGWRSKTGAMLPGAMLVVAGLLHAAVYWPGIMIWDAIRQYGEALSGRYDDWHPPLLDWLWRQTLAIAPGPGPMLTLQLLLYWGGFALLSARAAGDGRKRLAWALAAFAFLPLAVALLGEVMKDAMMAASLVAATGLIAWRRPWAEAGALALLLFAAALRFNALFAALPLLLALLPRGWRSGRLRFAFAAAVGAALLLLPLPAANRLLDARPSGVGLSLVIFDLGGITARSGESVFPPLEDVDDPVAVSRGCYSPAKWDRYAWWGEDPCDIGFDNVGAAYRTLGQSPYRAWAAAVAAHPLAYAAHRLSHFNVETRFLARGRVEQPAFAQSDPNPWGFRVRPNAALGAIERLVLLLDATPLGWPCCWLALAVGVLVLAPRLRPGSLAVPLAASSLLYGLSYLLLGVAAEMQRPRPARSPAAAGSPPRRRSSQ
jgi:hypothetical protein